MFWSRNFLCHQACGTLERSKDGAIEADPEAKQVGVGQKVSVVKELAVQP